MFIANKPINAITETLYNKWNNQENIDFVEVIEVTVVPLNVAVLFVVKLLRSNSKLWEWYKTYNITDKIDARNHNTNNFNRNVLNIFELGIELNFKLETAEVIKDLIESLNIKNLRFLTFKICYMYTYKPIPRIFSIF